MVHLGCEKHLVYGGWLTEPRGGERPARVCLLLRALITNRPAMAGPELEEPLRLEDTDLFPGPFEVSNNDWMC